MEGVPQRLLPLDAFKRLAADAAATTAEGLVIASGSAGGYRCGRCVGCERCARATRCAAATTSRRTSASPATRRSPTGPTIAAGDCDLSTRFDDGSASRIGKRPLKKPRRRSARGRTLDWRLRLREQQRPPDDDPNRRTAEPRAYASRHITLPQTAFCCGRRIHLEGSTCTPSTSIVHRRSTKLLVQGRRHQSHGAHELERVAVCDRSRFQPVVKH